MTSSCNTTSIDNSITNTSQTSSQGLSTQHIATPAFDRYSSVIFGSWNMPCLLQARRIIRNTLLSSPDDALHGWIDRHDIACLVDVKPDNKRLDIYKKLSPPLFRNKALFISSSPTGRPQHGVALAIDANIMVDPLPTANSENWSLPEVLQGRFIAVRVCVPKQAVTNVNGGHNMSNMYIKLWFIGVYSPISSDPDLPLFYLELSKILTEKIDGQHVYLMGDFNGHIDPAVGRHLIRKVCETYTIAAHPGTPGDKELMNFVTMEQSVGRVWTPLYTLIEDYHASTHYTHVDRKENTTTFSTIDQIWALDTTGITDCIIDSTFHSNPLNVTHMYGQLSDHIPISARINLSDIDNDAYTTQHSRTLTRTVLRIPAKDDAHMWDVLGQHLVGLRHHINNLNEKITQDFDPIAGNIPIDVLDEVTQQLQHVLGTVIPAPFRHTVPVRQVRCSLSQETLNIRRKMNALTNIQRAAKQLCAMQKGLVVNNVKLERTLRKRLARGDERYNIPAAPFAWNHNIDSESKEVADWLADATAQRDSLREVYLRSVGRDKKAFMKKRQENYDTEARMKTSRFRNIIFQTDSSKHVYTLLTEDGQQAILTPDGIEHEHLRYFKKLGTPINAPHDHNVSLEEFMNVPDMSGSRVKVSARSAEVFKQVTKEDIRQFVKERRSTAPGIDGINYAILRMICGDIPNVTEENKDFLQFMENVLLGIINTIFKTKIFPSSLLKGEIVCLHKAGDPRQLSNYRGITLLSCVYKLTVGIAAQRMFRILEEEEAISFMQAGTRANMSCLTKIAVLENLKHHAKRHKQSLYIFSSDLYKAFDKVHFDTFIKAADAIGFNDDVQTFITNLQANFDCHVRQITGAGRTTETVRIDVGCKQGCPLSALRFIMVFDIYLKWLAYKGLGYKWELRHPLVRTNVHPTAKGTKYLHLTEKNELCIPASAYCDDLMLFSNNREEMEYMVEHLNRFVIATGMRLSPLKCKFTSVHYNKHEQLTAHSHSPLRVHDCNNEIANIHWQEPSMPIAYLGYSLVLAVSNRKQGDNSSSGWAKHNDKMIQKFTDRCCQLTNGAVQCTDLVSILNSDIMSIIPYYAAAAHLTKTDIKRLKTVVWQTVYRKAHAMINLPRGALFIPADKNGFGIHDIKAVWATAAIDLLTLCLQTPDAICRATTIDTMLEASYEHNIDMFQPSKTISAKSTRFPTFLKTACNALHASKLHIDINKSNITPSSAPILTALLPFLTETHRRARITRILLSNKIWQVGDLLPSLTRPNETSGITQSGQSRSLIEQIVLNEVNTSWVELLPTIGKDVKSTIKFYGSKDKCAERGCLIDSLANMIDYWRTADRRHVPFMLPDRRCNGPIVVLAPPTDANSIGHVDIATDGSFESSTNSAGTGVTCGDNNIWFGPIPGMQSIDRAEAFGILTAVHCVNLTKRTSCTIWTDSRSTIEAIQKVQDTSTFQPRLNKQIANHSIVSAIVNELCMQRQRGVVTNIEWVKSHTDVETHTDIQYSLNRIADAAANKGRICSTDRNMYTPNILIDECYEYLQPFYLKHGDHIVEKAMHTTTLKRMISVAEQDIYETARQEGRTIIFNLSTPKQWKEAATSPRLTKTRTHAALNAFKIRLACNALRTPYTAGSGTHTLTAHMSEGVTASSVTSEFSVAMNTWHVNDVVQFTTTGTLPSVLQPTPLPLSPGVDYYVVSVTGTAPNV